jgi:hypothetical protein
MLATCKDDIFQPEAANTSGSWRVACSPECTLCCLNPNLGATRTPCDYVTLFRIGRVLKSVCTLTMKHVRATIVAVEKH